ncbi:response regulator [Phenylobacterium deserti]|uniref:Response regulator n=1 Tax=Phenylobacterium deserti TaxID=1914756 RepID=A0A328AVQ5_9CAUL|nr:response regulator [Phenylobacterium deserti]RAK57008.1 response regulator [Phenylobacterium deserti]
MTDTPPILILAVDDEILVLDLIASSLEDGGYSVLQASDAEEAFQTLEHRSADLGGLVTDVNLGRSRYSGWDIGRRARELRPDMPIVYVTGDSAQDWPSKGVPHSVVVMKPFAPAELVVAIASLRKVG